MLSSLVLSALAIPALAAEWLQRIEAESGTMTGTVRTENIIGSSGKTVSFIDNGSANALEIKITPQTANGYVMKLRYRSGEMRNLMYEINGQNASIITGFNSGRWSLFADMVLPVVLQPNVQNTIKFYAPDGENGPGLDYIEFSASKVPSLEKAGYRLIFNDEFDGSTLDNTLWVPEYLSSWTSKPALATPTYSLENGLMRLQIFEDTAPWCPEYDGKTVVSGFSTGNRNALHNWNGNNVVRNPVDTQMTHINQYGYYELRAKGQPGSSAWSEILCKCFV